MSLYRYRARLLKVVDADTLDLAIDLGLGIWTHQRVRLWGINAPERFTDSGKEATRWVTDALAPHETFEVQTYKDRGDKYGRYLAVVFLPSGLTVNDELVKAGHAVEYMRD